MSIGSLFSVGTTSSTTTLGTIDASSLLSYMNAKITSSVTQTVAAETSSASSSSSSASSAEQPPWDTPQPSSSPQEDAQALSTTNFINPDAATLTTGSSSSDKTQEDNEKLFSLYQGVNQLYYLAGMAQRSGMTSGQLVGFNTRFQTGLNQIQSYINSTSFNNFTLQAGQTSSSVTSSVSVPLSSFSYTGATIASDSQVGNALPNVNASDSFTVAVTKNGNTTNVPIDLSQVQGSLTMQNIVDYVNQQLQGDGFTTRFTQTITQGSINDAQAASYGIQITPGAGETVALSSASSTPSLYVAGTTGDAQGSTTTTVTNGQTTASTTPPDVQGNLVKLTAGGASLQGAFNQTVDPSSGTTTAQSTAVDSNGDVYVVGNATGNFGTEINQGSQDVYLSKYDSAGNLLWTQMLGSAGTASGYSLALNPQGGVVVAGSTTSQLTQTAISDGNTGSFVASYDANGNQNWVTQIPTIADNQANAVSMDASGNVYIGGQVTGVIGAGQTDSGGTNAYVTELDSSGNIVYEQQFGPSGNDHVAATATTADGGLVVASVQNGQAYLSKYANGDATQPPEWQIDLGNLDNGQLGNLAVSGNQIYLSGTTSNGNLTAGGQASVANAASGGDNGFVFNVTDNGQTAMSNYVSYVGNGGTTDGNSVAVGPDGTVYLAGTTTGTFAGQNRSVANVNNMYVAALNPDGTLESTNQYGGMDGQSTGQSIAIDPRGSSVLDALGLPRGTISLNQDVDLSSVSTAQAGDSFSIDVQGSAARNTTITIGQDETLQSLADQINDALLFNGKASVTYGANGQQLSIAVNPGVTASLVAGPSDSNALSRLGIPAGTLTAPPKSTAGSSSTTSSSNNSSPSSSSSSPQVFGLGLTGTMNISTTSGAGAARAELGNVLAAIRNAYTTTNTPPSSTSSTQTSTGTAPGYLSAQLANYNLGLSLLEGSSSTSSVVT